MLGSDQTGTASNCRGKASLVATVVARRDSVDLCRIGAWPAAMTNDEVVEQFRRGELVFDVADSGPADGQVVVLLHGWPQSAAAWSAVIPRLTASGYRCLAPNQRGFSPGARPSRRRDYTLSELAGDVRALIDASGAAKVHVVGHDFGGLVGWSLAASHGERINSFTTFSAPHPVALQRAMMTSRQGLASWYALFYQLPRIPERHYLGRDGSGSGLSRMLRAGGQRSELADRDAAFMARPGALTAALNWYRPAPWSARVGRVDVPTMLVWSDGDKYILGDTARKSARYVSGPYRFVELNDASHWIPDERPDTVADLLLTWFCTYS